jgi:hypothetical protein
VIPATLDQAEITRCLDESGTTAIVKLGCHFSKVRPVLHELGLLDSARYIDRATLPNQRMTPLACIDEANVLFFDGTGPSSTIREGLEPPLQRGSRRRRGRYHWADGSTCAAPDRGGAHRC